MNAEEFLRKHGLENGSSVEVEAAQGKFAGTVIQSFEPDVLTLKLGSGYNVGIEIRNIKSARKLEGQKNVGKPAAAQLKRKEGLPAISILHTGGTIASRIDYRTGAVYSAFTPEDLLTLFPELGEIANFESRLVANMWSDDLRFAHISLLAKEIEKEAGKGVRGIIVGMGTDNLASGAAAISFALGQCGTPVIVVGAQRSSDRGSSDAAMNLLCAARFIAQSDFAGVAICMHNSAADDVCAILPATKTRKLHTSRRDAFRAVNDTPIALVDYKGGKIEFIKKDYSRRKAGGSVAAKPNFEERVGLLKIHMHTNPAIFEFFAKEGYKGLVIEGTGLGQTPGHIPNKEAEVHKRIFPAIKKMAEDGCIVAMASQCIYGRVQMQVYDKARDLAALGVVSCEDMLAETAFVKLAWLLGNYSAKDAKRLMGENLRGEITARTGIETFDAGDKP